MSNMASVQVSTVDTMSPNDTCIRTILDSSTCRVTYTLKGGFGITQNRTNLCGGDNATHSNKEAKRDTGMSTQCMFRKL